MLARWLATEPRLLILDEPTRGIDVAAKQEIMDEILRLAREGMAVLFISSEIDEVVRVSHRIVVLRDRRKVGELPGGSERAMPSMTMIARRTLVHAQRRPGPCSERSKHRLLWPCVTLVLLLAVNARSTRASCDHAGATATCTAA